MVSKVALIGGAGYVGSVLAETLLSSGFEVTVLDNLMWGNGASLLGLAGREKFRFDRFDIREPESIELSEFDVFVVLAGLVGDPITRQVPETAESVNGRGVVRFLDAVADIPHAHKIFISTCSNYGKLSQGTLATEETQLSPLSPYARQKVQAENFILSDERLCASTTVLRFSTAYGLSPRMRHDLTVTEFVGDAVATGELRIYDADTWRPYAHVVDLSRAVCRVIDGRQSLDVKGVFNVGFSSENFTKRMIGEMVQKALPATRIVFDGNSGDARDYRVSFEKFDKMFGLSPSHTLEEHVPQLVKVFQSGLLNNVVSNLPMASRNHGSFLTGEYLP